MSKLREWMWPKPYKSYDGYYGPVYQWAARITLAAMAVAVALIWFTAARACFP